MSPRLLPFHRTVSALVIVCSSGLSRLTADPLLPVETFFDDSSIRQMALSPDGNKVALIAPNDGRYALALLDTVTGKTSVVVRFNDENIRSVFWKGNDRLLFTSAVEGHEIPLLASTDLQGKNVRRILESRRRRDDFSIFFGTLVDRFPASDDHILIRGYTGESDASRIAPSVPSNPTPFIYRVNVETAKRLQVTPLERGQSDGFYDREGNLRLAVFAEGAETTLRARSRNGEAWRDLRRVDPFEPEIQVLSLSQSGETAYVLDYSVHDRGVLRTMDSETGSLGPILFDPPVGEIERLIFSDDRTRLLGVAYQAEKRQVHWLDEAWRALVTTLEEGFKGYEITVVSISRDEKRFLFVASSDRNPGIYYLGDLRGKGLQVQALSSVRPAIKADQMRPMEIVEIPARDGLRLQGYLTRPVAPAGERVPLILLPHGGPWARDSWGFDTEAQFLANRGYAVLQVNFRGSTGYGRAFLNAGDQEWGDKMQHDLSDSVQWAIEQGIADPASVGIMGGSYGGYAALAGVAFTPDLYRVGINIVGVADLRLITRYDLGGSFLGKRNFERRIGSGEAFLSARSPVDLIAAVRVPTFHAYGRNDPRVEIEHWTGLEAQLKKHGKTYQIHLEEEEGHGFEKAEAAIKLYRAIDEFLAHYMPTKFNRDRVTLGELKVVEMPAKK